MPRRIKLAESHFPCVFATETRQKVHSHSSVRLSEFHLASFGIHPNSNCIELCTVLLMHRSSEAAEAAERESEWVSAHAMSRDCNAAASVSTSDVFGVQKGHGGARKSRPV